MLGKINFLSLPAIDNVFWSVICCSLGPKHAVVSVKNIVEIPASNAESLSGETWLQILYTRLIRSV